MVQTTTEDASGSSLSERQSKFVDAYVLGTSATEAARRAGYGERGAAVTATRLLRNANVQAVLAARRAENAVRFNLDRDRVISELQAAIALAREKGDPAAMIAGWREIAKMCGFYTPERQARALPGGGQALLARFEAMRDAELLAISDGGPSSPSSPS